MLTESESIAAVIVNSSKMYRVFLLSVLIFQGACTLKDNIFDVPVRNVMPEQIISVNGHKVDLGMNAPIGISNIYFIDSLLLMKTPQSSSLYTIFSLHTFSCYDSKIRKGRGPCEFMAPICEEEFFSADKLKSMYVFDLNLCKSFKWVPVKNLHNGHADLTELVALPPGTLNAMPYSDSLHLIRRPNSHGIIYSICDSQMRVVKEMTVYEKISGTRYIDKLSSSDAVCPGSSKVVMAMCMFPQINFLDMENGEKKSVAVKSGIKHWSKTLQEENAEAFIYYMSLCRSKDRIIALYYGVPLIEMATEKCIPHIHVFNWDGDFLYDISISENLRSITYDNEGKVLYGLDNSDNIYRYDISFI